MKHLLLAAMLKDGWRLPTKKEFEELISIWDCDNYGAYGRNNRITFYNNYLTYLCNTKVNVKEFNQVFTTFKDARPIMQCKGIVMKSVIRLVHKTKGINLGLSVNWMECNLGAVNPEDIGWFYSYVEYKEILLNK